MAVKRRATDDCQGVGPLARMKLTKRMVDQVRPGARPVYYFDTELPGFFPASTPSSPASSSV